MEQCLELGTRLRLVKHHGAHCVAVQNAGGFKHCIAKGLERTSMLPGDLDLRFRMVSTMLPEAPKDAFAGEPPDERQILAQLEKSLEHMGVDSRRMVMHLP